MRKSLIGSVIYRTQKRSALLIGKLFTDSIHINGTTYYNMTNCDVGIAYHDGTSRFIKRDWFDDHNFEEPSDDAIEEIALNALLDSQFTVWYDNVIDQCCIEVQLPREMVAPKHPTTELVHRYCKEILKH